MLEPISTEYRRLAMETATGELQLWSDRPIKWGGGPSNIILIR